MDDVSDFIVALESLPKSELSEYLSNVLGDAAAANEIAVLMGATAPAASAPAVPTPAASTSIRPESGTKARIVDNLPRHRARETRAKI